MKTTSNMEKYFKTIPFNLDIAKKIATKQIDGSFVYQDKVVRILSFDFKNYDMCIAVAILHENGTEKMKFFNERGLTYDKYNKLNDRLYIRAPEYLTFKDGDIITCGFTKNGIICKWVSIFKEFNTIVPFSYKDYASYLFKSTKKYNQEYTFDVIVESAQWSRRSTDKEKKILEEYLSECNVPLAKDYLIKFFGHKEEPQHKFKPFDKVLVRMSKEDKWECSFFSNYTEEVFKYRCCGMNYPYCIPYEGNENLVDEIKN